MGLVGEHGRPLPKGPVVYRKRSATSKFANTGLDWDAMRENSGAADLDREAEVAELNRKREKAREKKRAALNARRVVAREARVSMRGENNRRLDSLVWDKIVARYLDGEGTEDLAREYGIAAPSIAHHVKAAGHTMRTRSESLALHHARQAAKRALAEEEEGGE